MLALMSRQTSVGVLAVAAYCLFWLAVLFGYLRVDSSDVSDAVFHTLRGAAVVLPAFALGFVVGRWWAVLAGLVFLLAAILPERTVIDGGSIDAVLLGDFGVSIGRALGLIALTTPCVIAGLMARGMVQPVREAERSRQP
jgi:urea transporter